MIKIPHEHFKPFVQLAKTKKLYIQGNILKVLQIENGDAEDTTYLEEAKKEFKNRSEITYKQQKETLTAIDEATKKSELNEQLIVNLKDKEQELERALASAENVRDKTIAELDAMQKRSQTELRSKVIKYALIFIGYILFITPIVYISVIFLGTDNQSTIMGNLLSNVYVSALSSTFGSIATILGLRAAEKANKDS